MAKWQQLLGQTALAFASGCSGVILYRALFPGFYYMDWIFWTVMLWGLAAIAFLGHCLVLWIIARCKRVALPPSPLTGAGFIAGMLILVTLLVGFKVPLHTSFLWARPALEKAIAEYSDDLDQIGQRYYYFGVYSIRRAYRGCHKKDRIYFQFRDDAESAIIYSESGIKDLCYNSGNKGHLFGNWYWMKED